MDINEGYAPITEYFLVSYIEDNTDNGELPSVGENNLYFSGNFGLPCDIIDE